MHFIKQILMRKKIIVLTKSGLHQIYISEIQANICQQQLKCNLYVEATLHILHTQFSCFYSCIDCHSCFYSCIDCHFTYLGDHHLT